MKNSTLDKFDIICTNYNAKPVVLFARATFEGNQTLLLLSGPSLDLEKIKELRADINQALDEKEKQLKETGPTGPSILVAPIPKK